MVDKMVRYMFYSGFILLIAGVHILNLLFASILMLSGIGVLIVTILLMGVASQMRDAPPQWPPVPYKGNV